MGWRNLVKKKYTERARNILVNTIGIDVTISYTLSTQVVNAVKGFISILFISKYLSPQEQGFHYTFASITALQVFFELGFSAIITQYAAHEKAHLTIQEKNIEGDEVHKNRLSSLLRLCIKWFGVMSIGLLITLLIAGHSFFTHNPNETNVSWQMPWIIICIGTAISLFISPIFAFCEGLGQIQQIAKLRFYLSFIPAILYFLALYLGAKLYAAPISGLLNIVFLLAWLVYTDNKILLKNIWNNFSDVNKISWRNEIFPYQAKIAVSWISGYFMFQIMNPVIFSFFGAKAAGQMGMTLAILYGLFGLVNAWIVTKVPLFSELISRKEYSKLDNIFNIALKQSVLILCVAALTAIFGAYAINYFDLVLKERLLPVLPFTIIMLTSLPMFINNSLATYLRCHKEEPYLVISILSGLLSITLIYFSSKYMGLTAMTMSYFTVISFATIGGYFIFKEKKKLWHQ